MHMARSTNLIQYISIIMTAAPEPLQTQLKPAIVSTAALASLILCITKSHNITANPATASSETTAQDQQHQPSAVQGQKSPPLPHPHPGIYQWSKQPAVATPCNGYYRQATKPTSYCSKSINTKHQHNLGLFNQKVVTTKSAYSLNHFNSYEETAAWSSRPAQPSQTEEKPGNALSKAASGLISPNGQCFSNSKGKKTGTTSGNPMHVSIVAKLQQ
ncbi:hypothetical protein Nepgr_005935 [Nepenthes gracilis]|uniref:Uncharacterized protein n=1 Tax=Nepenthes gracilis TaxID=150966 RepID=A0AAD3XH28_NEPGR|nr:hypothetical protein Nepgr_005935 [Nepenthes gracilis]